jgi:2-oxo-hept-3-ene-1,7-dioate hydratase
VDVNRLFETCKEAEWRMGGAEGEVEAKSVQRETRTGVTHGSNAAPAIGGDDIRDVAQRLDEAERLRTQMPLLSQQYPGATLDHAYAVQREWMKLKFAAGRRMIGRKVGLTSRAMQQAVGINSPDSGVLLDDMLFDDGATIPGDRFIKPRVEAELAFVMRRRLRGPHVTMCDVLRCTAYVQPCLEILDTRIVRVDSKAGRQRTVVDTVADNAANAGVVLGGHPTAAERIDLRWSGVILHRNGVVEETGLAAAVLNHPARAVAWLCNRLALEDEGIDAGHIVLSGSFIRPVEVTTSDVFHADFGPLGSVSCRFG